MANKHLIVLPDPHIRAKAGGEDKKSIAAVEKYIKDAKPDEIICIGDFMDFDCISDHNARNLRVVEGETVSADYEVGNAVLDRWQKLCKRVVLLEGNHDYRVERFIDAYPRMAGSLEVEKGLRLKERGIKWVRSWSKGEVYRVGNANFIHGLYVNDHHAKKTVEAFGVPVFYGHTHDIQLYSKTTAGDNKTIVGQSLGCLCDYRQFYMKGRPNRWQQAFGEFWVRPDGYFNYTVTMIFKNRFVTAGGKEYSA
jgi:predicted MPP superfamily phosphohydrolase